jgi:hypothetical protein
MADAGGTSAIAGPATAQLTSIAEAKNAIRRALRAFKIS